MHFLFVDSKYQHKKTTSNMVLNMMPQKEGSLSREVFVQVVSVQQGLCPGCVSVQDGLCPGWSLSRMVSVRETPLPMWTDRQL